MFVEASILPGQRNDRAISRTALAGARLRLARSDLAACRWCRHDCGADRREGAGGRCHAGPLARWFSAQTEVGDELELVPTFAVALSGCNLRCAFCVTGESSWNAGAGAGLDASGMAERAAAALRGGARTVMILGGEPTIHLVSLLELVSLLPGDARLVLKTNAWFSPRARELLQGLFDVWLPDFKFGNDTCAERLSGVRDYWAVVTGNLRWLACWAGGEMMVRHLVMPGHVECCWAPIARWLASELPGARVSLRDGYWPGWKAARHHELRGTLSRSEWNLATAEARRLGLELVI